MLDVVRDMGDLPTDNTAYTAIQGVFQSFRARLTPEQGIAFAGVLPAIPRAIFVAGWDIGARPRPFGTRAEMTAEAQALRQHHNLSRGNVIRAVSIATWRLVDHRDFARVLNSIGPQAQAFWTVEDAHPDELARRII